MKFSLQRFTKEKHGSYIKLQLGKNAQPEQIIEYIQVDIIH